MDNSEVAFRKLMAEAQLENVSFEEEEGVNLDSANELIERLSKELKKSGMCSNEGEDEAREMIITLENLKKMLPDSEDITIALKKLHNIRSQSLAETA